MLSAFLTSSYLQYKEDTNVVASWLATTAEKCGYVAVEEGNGSSNNKKKKNQKRSMGKSSVQRAKAPQRKGDARLIAIRDFVRLAECIAKYDDPPVSVPEDLVRTITRAISVRRSHGERLPRKKEQADQRHNYFIFVLESVFNVLQPRIASASTDASNNAAPSNRFDGLGVQEPSEQFLQAPDITPTSVSDVPEVTYEAEILKDLEEALVAFTLLLEDYDKFRALISQTWEGYRQGIFDLVAASLTTNTALELARRIEEDAKPLFKNFGGSEGMLALYYESLCMASGEDPNTKERKDDEMNFRMYEKAESIFFPAYQFVSSFVAMVEPDFLPQYKPGFYGVYNPNSDRSKKSARDRYKEDKIILLEILPEFCLICKGAEKIVGEDEFIRGLRTAFTTHEVPLSLVLSAQIYLDIHHVLRDRVSQGFVDLQKTGKFVDSSIELTFKFHKELKIQNWPRMNDMAFLRVQEWVHQWVKNDPCAEAKRMLRQPAGEKFRFVKSHPLFCGLFAYSIKVQLHDVSVAFVNAWGSVLYTSHLYNAVRQEKLLETKWKDMNILLNLQGRDFLGDQANGPEDYLKRFALSIGYSATAFAKDKREGPLEASKKGPKTLETLAPVAHMFAKSYCTDDRHEDLSLQDLEKILSKSRWEEEEIAEGLSELSFNRPANKDGDSNTKKPQLSAVGLLQHLRHTLLAESFELNFDYLGFHRVCWLLLRSINSFCENDLRGIFGSEYLEMENQLPFTVGYIFMAATNTSRLGKLLVEKKDDVVTSKLMAMAASVMDAYIKQCGNFVCRVLETQCNIKVQDEEE